MGEGTDTGSSAGSSDDSSDDRPGTAGANAAWSVISSILAGILAWGGIGWLVDHFLGTSFAFPIGMLIGAGAAMYLVVKRFGHVGERPQQGTPKDEKTE
jgi:ATP synthase protein I